MPGTRPSGQWIWVRNLSGPLERVAADLEGRVSGVLLTLLPSTRIMSITLLHPAFCIRDQTLVLRLVWLVFF